MLNTFIYDSVSQSKLIPTELWRKILKQVHVSELWRIKYTGTYNQMWKKKEKKKEWVWFSPLKFDFLRNNIVNTNKDSWRMWLLRCEQGTTWPLCVSLLAAAGVPGVGGAARAWAWTAAAARPRAVRPAERHPQPLEHRKRRPGAGAGWLRNRHGQASGEVVFSNRVVDRHESN